MPADITALVDDLLAETTALEEILADLPDVDFELVTPAPVWTVRDQITHLTYFDAAVTRAIVDPDEFRTERDAALSGIAGIDDFTGHIAEQGRAMPIAEVRDAFATARSAMVAAFRSADPKLRVPWYGPDMGLASALTARIMETWAHGQDVEDALHVQRRATRALRNVAHLGVATMGYSFMARDLAPPSTPVRVELRATDGVTWEWGPADAVDRIAGEARDFCLVVTQRRHVADTQLVAEGPVAREWMAIAQCFAGPAGQGRTAGQFS
jgi:uncharacterized protein (TIGR03084 family)